MKTARFVSLFAMCSFAVAANAQCTEGWRVEPGAVGGGFSWNVRAAAIYQGDIYLGGEFQSPTPWIARKQGDVFVPVGAGLPGPVYALLIHDERLYAGGPGVRAWDGSAWKTTAVDAFILALCEWKGDMYAGGWFSTIGGVSAKNIARWDGSQWAPLGPGLSALFGLGVYSLCTFDGNLVAGGSFYAPGAGIAGWNGTNWFQFGSGLHAIEAPQVQAVREYHGKLYAGGLFDSPVRNLARWTGTVWEPVGSPITGFDYVLALHVWHDRLVAGGGFQRIGGVPAESIALWDGAQWQPPAGGGVKWEISAFADRGDDMIAAGIIERAGGLTGGNWAIYGCSCYPDCNADGALNISDFGCFQTKFALGDVYADCNADGVRNLADFGCFQTRFALGCP